VPAELHAELLAIVRHRMSSNPVKVEAEINLTCFGIDGVDALKAALLAARQVGTAEIPISVTVKAFVFPVLCCCVC
jgi:translation initiation factor 2 subunit 1